MVQGHADASRTLGTALCAGDDHSCRIVACDGKASCSSCTRRVEQRRTELELGGVRQRLAQAVGGDDGPRGLRRRGGPLLLVHRLEQQHQLPHDTCCRDWKKLRWYEKQERFTMVSKENQLQQSVLKHPVYVILKLCQASKQRGKLMLICTFCKLQV